MAAQLAWSKVFEKKLFQHNILIINELKFLFYFFWKNFMEFLKSKRLYIVFSIESKEYKKQLLKVKKH